MKKDRPKAAIAAVLRDHKGIICDGGAILVHSSSVLQGEILAIRLAGQLLQANHITNGTIESDNKMAIKLCSTENVPPWDCAAVVEDIGTFTPLVQCSFSWSPGLGNRAAHWVATQFLNGSIPADWAVNLPPFLSIICNSDASFEVFDQ